MFIALTVCVLIPICTLLAISISPHPGPYDLCLFSAHYISLSKIPLYSFLPVHPNSYLCSNTCPHGTTSIFLSLYGLDHRGTTYRRTSSLTTVWPSSTSIRQLFSSYGVITFPSTVQSILSTIRTWCYNLQPSWCPYDLLGSCTTFSGLRTDFLHLH